MMIHRSSVSIFDSKKRNAIKDWKIVNDDVMGGGSKSTVYFSENGFAIFEGEISLDNNGGFAMVQYDCEVNSIKRYNYITLKLIGDGKTYQLRVKDDKNNHYSYIQNFKTSGNLETVTILLNDFRPQFRGKKLDLENFAKKKIEQVAILIGNKKEEKFKLEIVNIQLN